MITLKRRSRQEKNSEQSEDNSEQLSIVPLSYEDYYTSRDNFPWHDDSASNDDSVSNHEIACTPLPDFRQEQTNNLPAEVLEGLRTHPGRSQGIVSVLPQPCLDNYNGQTENDTSRRVWQGLRYQRKLSTLKSAQCCCRESIGTVTLVMPAGRWEGMKRCNRSHTCVYCRRIKMLQYRDEVLDILSVSRTRGVKVAYFVGTMTMHSTYNLKEAYETIMQSLSKTFDSYFRSSIDCIGRITHIETVRSLSGAWNVHSNTLLFFAPGSNPENCHGKIVSRWIQKVGSVDEKRKPMAHAQYYRTLPESEHDVVGKYITKSDIKQMDDSSISKEMMLSGSKTKGGLDLLGLAIRAGKDGGEYISQFRELQLACKGRKLYNKTRGLKEKIEILPILHPEKMEEKQDEEKQDDDDIRYEADGRLWSLIGCYKLEYTFIRVLRSNKDKALNEMIVQLMEASTWTLCEGGLTFDELRDSIHLIYTRIKSGIWCQIPGLACQNT